MAGLTSRLVLGTAAFGPYAGLPALSEREATDLVYAALGSGVRHYDTAPAYPGAEQVLGKALQGVPDVTIATKVTVPQKPLHLAALRDAILFSLDTSAQQLRRPLRVVQVHNYAADSFMAQRTLDILQDMPLQLRIGVTVYDPIDAHAALLRGAKLVQLPYNLLDQRARTSGFFKHVRTTWPDVTVWSRSVWLRGVLADPGHWTARRLLTRNLPEAALRFSAVQGPTVIGVRTVQELDAACAALGRGPLPWPQSWLARTCAQSDPQQYDPRTWSLS